jgi:hypothetical protein
VIGPSGLLAVFNDAGVIDPLDVAAAMSIGRLLAEPDESVRLAAALAVRGTRFGHVCIRLDTIRQAVVVDGQDLESIEALPWPDPDSGTIGWPPVCWWVTEPATIRWCWWTAGSIWSGTSATNSRWRRMILRRCAQPAGVITQKMAAGCWTR